MRAPILILLAAVAAQAQLLPSWLRFSAEERVRLEGFVGGGFQDSHDAYALNRVRVNMGIVPTHWLQFRFQMQDARAELKTLRPYAAPFQDTFNLRVAYAEFGERDKLPASFRFGRQEINLGDERLVGSSNWTNTARTFDAARLALHFGKIRVDAFAASPVVLHDGDVGDHVPGNNLHGLYGGLENVVPQATIEPYVLWRLNQRLKTETGTTGNLDFTTVGIRWVGKIRAVDYLLEMARQQGSLGTDRIAAWAGHWLLAVRTKSAWKVRPLAEYNFATGDHNSSDGRRRTFDQLFFTGHEKNGLADQVGWRNIQHGRVGFEAKPASKWGLTMKLSGFWLDDPHDALYNSSGTATVRKADGSAGRFVGTEMDGTLSFVATKWFQISGGFARLFAGTFLKHASGGKDYSYPYLMLTLTL